MQPSVWKVIASIFWDHKGILFINYLERGLTVTLKYYEDVLKQLQVNIKEKRREALTSKVLLLHVNAPAHTSNVGRPAISECGFETIDHPPYSLDLAPSDYFFSLH